MDKKKQNIIRYLPFVPIVNIPYLFYICIRMQQLRLFTTARMFKLIIRILPLAICVAAVSNFFSNVAFLVEIVEILWLYIVISYSAYFFSDIVGSFRSKS